MSPRPIRRARTRTARWPASLSRRFLLCASLSFGTVAAPVWAAPDAPAAPSPESAPSLDADQLRQAQSIARQTMSPFCPGRTLADCPSEYAAAWRREIQVMLARGDSPQQIQEEFERRAGGDLSGRPHRGVGYGLSFALAGASLAVLYGVLRLVQGRRRPAGAAAATPEGASPGDAGDVPAPLDETLEARLEQELRAELDDDDET